MLRFRKVDEKLARNATDLAGAANGFNWRQDADAAVGYTTKSFCWEQEEPRTTTAPTAASPSPLPTGSS